MNKSENVQLKGRVEIITRDRNGKILQKEVGDNLVVTVGKNKLAYWLAQSSTNDYFMRYVEVGEGSTQPQVTDTSLEDPLSPRVAGVVENNDAILKITATFDYGVCSGAITEAGLFDSLTEGTMFARKVFNVINKSDDVAMDVIWMITIS